MNEAIVARATQAPATQLAHTCRARAPVAHGRRRGPDKSLPKHISEPKHIIIHRQRVAATRAALQAAGCRARQGGAPARALRQLSAALTVIEVDACLGETDKGEGLDAVDADDGEATEHGLGGGRTALLTACEAGFIEGVIFLLSRATHKACL